MKNRSYLISAIFIIGFFHSIAGEIIVNQNNKNQFKIIENSYSVLRLKTTVSLIIFSNIETQQGSFTKLNISNFGHSNIPGEPELPVLKELIEIPFNAEVNINIISTTFKDFNLGDLGVSNFIIPAHAPVSKEINEPESIEYVLNEESYSKNQFIGQEPVIVKVLGTMRGVHFGRLEIAPVQYNPVQNIIRVFEEIEVEISFTGGNSLLIRNKKKELFSPFFEKTYNKIINYKPIPTDELITNAPITYIIVSDPMFEDDLQEFIQWKTKKGFRVIEAYTDDPAVGNTTETIKAHLEDLYNNPPQGYYPQSFVLLVGDVAQIPSFFGGAGGHYTDLYYCEYTGDVYPECYYGRFSANNSLELIPQISKILEYEKYQFPYPPFLDSAVLVSGVASGYDTLWLNGQIYYAATEYINEEHGIFPFIYLQPQPSGVNYSELIIQNINNGISFLNYTGHCSVFGFSSPAFSIGHIQQLSNTHKYPLMIGNCCSSASFGMNCFGEAIVRAADKGALSYIGATNSTYWDEDYWWAVGFKAVSSSPSYNPDYLGFYDRLFHDHSEPLDQWYITQGQFAVAGNLAVTQSGSYLDDYYWEVYHLLGDPSVTIYLPEPYLPAVNYQSSIPPEISTFTVNTEPYLYVALSMNGVLHGAALSDENGLAEIEIFEPITEPGVADIVVTGQNIEPFFGTVQVEYSEGAFVVLESFEIDDSSGNNNGQADNGEDVLLDILLVNVGNANALNLTASLSSVDTNITITDNTNNWPDIEPGTSSIQEGAFSFYVHEDAISGHYALFNLEITDGDSLWNSTFSITLHSVTTSVSDIAKSDPLKQINIYPNPFRDQFTIEYFLSSKSNVRILLLNWMCQEVAQIENSSNKLSGKHKVVFMPPEMQSGIYFCKIETDDFSVIRKIILKR